MSDVNLFVRVPRLGLPDELQKFLLFNMSTDDVFAFDLQEPPVLISFG